MGTLDLVRTLAVLTMFSLVSHALQAQSLTIAEQYLLSAVNQERLARHVPPVHPDAALMMAAKIHAQAMVDHQSISHQFSGESELSKRGSASGARFDRITENVAEGPSVLDLHEAWMKSPGHRANILDKGVDAVGIAVLSWHGQLYAVEDFQSTVLELSLEQQEGAIAALLERDGVELVPDANARKTCGMASGYAGDRQPAFIVRYTTGDLSILPDQLKQRLRLAQDHQASVGACAVNGTGVFSGYNVAVLLF